MRETEAHGSEVLGVESLEERRELLSNSSVQVHRRRVAHNLDAELLRDSSSELGVPDDESLLDGLSLLGRALDLVDEELGEDLRELAVLELGEVLDGIGGRRESVDSLQLEAGSELGPQG